MRNLKRPRYSLSESPQKSEQPQIIITPPTDDGGNNGLNDVSVRNNRIYFYAEVNRDNILALNQALVDLDNTIRSQNIEWSVPNQCVKIYLHINSEGGSLFDSFSTIDYIRRMKTKVVSVIDGCAASAATLISVSCHERQMNQHSLMLIHQLSSFLHGTYENIKDEANNCDMFMEMIRKVYKEHARIPDKKLNQILKRDLWLSSSQCLKYGLIDEII
jgi:ATP-dependent Clp endopeptidase proteolytic subunit ClpP